MDRTLVRLGGVQIELVFGDTRHKESCPNDLTRVAPSPIMTVTYYLLTGGDNERERNVGQRRQRQLRPQ